MAPSFCVENGSSLLPSSHQCQLKISFLYTNQLLQRPELEPLTERKATRCYACIVLLCRPWPLNLITSLHHEPLVHASTTPASWIILPIFCSSFIVLRHQYLCYALHILWVQ